MSKMQERWQEMQETGMFKYLLYNAFFFRIPLGLVLLVINFVFKEGLYFWQGDDFSQNLGLVVVIFLVLSFIIGSREWKFYKNAAEGYYQEKPELKRKAYIIINGILGWGLAIGIVDFLVQNRNEGASMIIPVLWLVVGYFFGSVMYKQDFFGEIKE